METKTTVCSACEGVGYFDRYYNEFDIVEVRCDVCDGTGEAQ